MTHFPTREGPIDYAINRGNPKPAIPCRCSRPIVDEDGMCLCGRYTEETIILSWLEAAASA